MESAYENGVHYRDPNELLRRAHNYLVLRNDSPDSQDSGDRDACNILWKLHVYYFTGELSMK